MGVVDFTKLWIGEVFGTESEIYSCHEQNLQNMRKIHGPFLMNFNSRAMTTHLLTILFATCSVAFTLFLYFSTLLLWLFVCTWRFSSSRRFSCSRCVIWIETVTIITVVRVYIISTAITYKTGLIITQARLQQAAGESDDVNHIRYLYIFRALGHLI